MNQSNKSAVGRFIRLLLVVAYTLGIALMPLLVGAVTTRPLDEARSTADELILTVVGTPLSLSTAPLLPSQKLVARSASAQGTWTSLANAPGNPKEGKVLVYASGTRGLHPHLTGSFDPVVVADTYIEEEYPNGKNGGDSSLSTKPHSGERCFSLLRFDLSDLPAGVTVLTATLNIYENTAQLTQTVYVRRITDPWDETKVTWKSFGSAYDSTTSYGSFDPATTDWKQVDVTPLVQLWADGTDNYGLLLEPSGANGEVKYDSRDNDSGKAAYLDVSYTDLAISKTLVSPTDGTAVVGETVTFTIRITNTGSVTATTLPLTDTYDVNYLTFNDQAKPTPDGVDLSGGVITWTDILTGDLGLGNSVTVTVAFRAYNVITSTTNIAHALGKEASADVKIESDLRVVKELVEPADGVAVVGEDVQFRITVANDSQADINDIKVTDSYSQAKLDYQSATPVPNTVDETNGLLTWLQSGSGTLVPISPGNSKVITINFQAIASTVPTVTVNHVAVDATDEYGNDIAETSQASVTVQAQADLKVSKADFSDPVAAGETLTYTLTVTNNGPNDATGVTVTDTLPSGVSYVSATSTQDSCSQAGGVVTCTLGSLASGGSARVIITVTVGSSTAGTITNTAGVTGTSADPTPGNNMDSEATQVNVQPDQVTLLGFRIKYLGTTSNVDGTYTWTYMVSATDVVTKALSYWELTGLCTDTVQALVEPVSIPDDQEYVQGTYTLVRSTSEIITYTVEAKANVGSIKFEDAVNEEGKDDGLGEDGAVEIDTFELVFNRNFAREMVGVSAKAAPITESGEILGPAGADLAISKTDSPDPVIAGNSLSYTLVIPNSGPCDANGVTVTDTLPSEVTFRSASSGWTYDPVTHKVTCTLGTLDNGATVTATIVVTVHSSTLGTITNTATVTTTTPDPDTADNTATEETTVKAEADLVVSKSDDRDPVVAGETLTYTLTVTNGGPSDATGVTVTDRLASEVSFGSASSGWTYDPVTHNVTCTLGTLNNGATVTATIVVTVHSSTLGTITNTATVTTTTPDPDTADNTATQETTVNAEADLVVSKSDDPDPVVAGETLTYTLTVTNGGPSDATGVTVTDTLPSEVTFGSASSGWSYDPVTHNVTCTLGTLNNGATVTATIVVTVHSSTLGTITNTATVTTTTPDPDTADNTATQETTVNAEADLVVSKSDDPDPVVAGETLTYTLTVTNGGPSDATGVTVTDRLASEVTFGSASSGCTYDPGPHKVTCSIGALNNGDTATAIFVVTVDSSTTGTITNTATVAANESDPNTANNTDSEETTVNAAADLAIITRSDDPEPLVAGRTLTYTLVYSNSGPSDAQDVYITRTLPSGVTYGGVVSQVPSIAGPTVTLPYLTWYTPTLAGGASGTIVLTVTVNARGTASSVRISSSTPDPNPGGNFDDGDGVGGEVEDGAPNNGDGNNDGVPDSQQEHVTSLPNAIDQRYVTLASPGGTNFGSVQVCDNPSPGNAPPEVAFAVGCFECIVQGIPPGGSVAVTLFLPPGVAANTFDYYRFGATPDNPDPHWYKFLFDGTTGTGAEILGDEDRIILYLVDGGRGDDDLIANGEIIDWGCPGQPPPTPVRPIGGVTVPLSNMDLLAPWMGLAALMAVAAVMVRRRRA